MRADQQRCAATIGNVQCELVARHNSPHQNTSDGTMTWEPRYVADLRSELAQARREIAYLTEDNP